MTDGAVAKRPERQMVAPLNPDYQPTIIVRQVPGLPPERQEVERIEHVVTIPPTYQYQQGSIKVRRTKDQDTGRWGNVVDPQTGELLYDDTRSVGLKSDGYLLLNRTLGLDLTLAETVVGPDGQLHNNPIHSDRYIAIRGGIVFRSDFGQLRWYEETIEADFWQVYQDARVNAYSAKVVKKDGVPLIDEGGFPIFELSDDDERAAARVLLALRSSGLKRLQTSLFVRCLKVVTGIKTLPNREPAPIDVKLTTYRDLLTPQERVERALGVAATVYGGTGARRVVTPDEIEANLKEPDDDAEFLGREEADRVARSREDGPRNVTPPEPEPEPIDPATIPGVHRGMPGNVGRNRYRSTDDGNVVDTQTGEVITRDDLRARALRGARRR
jgi:hypothetical protein